MSYRHPRADETVAWLANRYAARFETAAVTTAVYRAITADDFLHDLADIHYRLENVMKHSFTAESDLAPRLRRTFWRLNMDVTNQPAYILRARADEVVSQTLHELSHLITESEGSQWDADTVAATRQEIEDALESPRWSR